MVVVAVMWKMIYDPDNGALNRFLGVVRDRGQVVAGRLLAGAAVGRADRHVGLLRAGDGAADRGRAEDPVVAVRRGAGRRRGGVPRVPRGDAAGAARGDRGRADADDDLRAAQLRPRLHHDPAAGPGDATTVPAFQVFTRAFETGQVGSAAAVGITLTAIIFVISLGINRFAERGRMTSRARADARLRDPRRVLADRAAADRGHRLHGAAGPGRRRGVRRPSTGCTSATSRTRGSEGHFGSYLKSARDRRRVVVVASPACSRSCPATRSG